MSVAGRLLAARRFVDVRRFRDKPCPRRRRIQEEAGSFRQVLECGLSVGDLPSAKQAGAQAGDGARGRSPLWEQGKTSNVKQPASHIEHRTSAPGESGVSPVPHQPPACAPHADRPLSKRWRDVSAPIRFRDALRAKNSESRLQPVPDD